MEELSGLAVNEVFRVIDLTGVLLNGILGGKLARSKRFDAVGFVILAIMSAMGGGIIRDVMLQQGPPIALTDPFYISTALVGAAIAFLWKLDNRFWVVALILADGIVLGSWAATGAIKTMSAGFGVMPALMLGITTAVGGGMIRDVTAGNVPQVFGGNNLYATPALVSAGVMVTLYSFGHPTLGMITATVVGSSFTVLAHWRKWQLPTHSDWSLSITPTQLKNLLATRPGLPGREDDADLPHALTSIKKEMDEVDAADAKAADEQRARDAGTQPAGRHRAREADESREADTDKSRDETEPNP